MLVVKRAQDSRAVGDSETIDPHQFRRPVNEVVKRQYTVRVDKDGKAAE